MTLPRKIIVAFVGIAVLLGGAAALYKFSLPGISSARQEPANAEIVVATWLLRHSVPEGEAGAQSARRRSCRYRRRARSVSEKLRDLPRL